MEQVIRRISYTKLQKVSKIFSALAHPVRLKILEQLEEGESKNVGEILKGVPVDPTLLTHHLNKMKYAGLLESEKDGRHVNYRLVMPEISSIFDCIDRCGI